MADGALFVLPVTVDETTPGEAIVPDRFRALHFNSLPGGIVPMELAQRLKDFMAARGQ
jgi:hypothetical protein